MKERKKEKEDNKGDIWKVNMEHLVGRGRNGRCVERKKKGLEESKGERKVVGINDGKRGRGMWN